MGLLPGDAFYGACVQIVSLGWASSAAGSDFAGSAGPGHGSWFIFIQQLNSPSPALEQLGQCGSGFT